MKITFLGTGTSQGVPIIACNCDVCLSTNDHDKRLRSSVLIEIDGKNIVIDAGPDFRQQMLNANVSNLSAIVLTHEHFDHIAGLDDIRAFNWVLKKPTDIYAEERVQNAIKNIFYYVFAEKKYPGIPEMSLHTIDENPFSIDGIDIIPIRGFHLELPVLGFRIKNFAYLTDFKTFVESEIEKLYGVDVLVVNALRLESHISHFTLDEAFKLIEKVKPRQAYLTHISHQMGRYEEVSKFLPQSIKLAYDGLELFL